MRIFGNRKAAKVKDKKTAYKKKMRLVYVLLALSIAATVVCAVGLTLELLTTRQGQQYYSSLTGDIERRPWPTGGYTPPANLPSSPSGETPGGSGTGSGTGSPGDGTDTGEEFVWTPYVNFDELSEEFRGLAAWLFQEGTIIDYPVMQWTNNSHFLNRLPDGSSHRNGALFIDSRNKPDFSDKNTLIYGHNMRSGDMFGGLRQYYNQAYYEANQIMYLFTPDRDYMLVIFAGYLLDSAVEVPPIWFGGEGTFQAHVREIKRRSLFRSDVEVSDDDRIVSLCTCNSAFTNARLILVGKLVDLGPFDMREVPDAVLD